MESLFQAWDEREGSNKKNEADKQSIDVNKLNSIDKNSRMLLNNILLTNKRYMKEEIPSNYKYDESSGNFVEIDITNKITPFTTNKKSLFDRLEIERQEYLSKKHSDNENDA